ncbi:Hypothetical predicted protein [Paramuricea clavata]|uniref:Uncharacterized protein n=1 Tax=Paramuricea clavata TaxID=317549 RepID=A0A6S7HV18_PARCT|nr:Hypothetical predicted protein [Paramuricea clavata]
MNVDDSDSSLEEEVGNSSHASHSTIKRKRSKQVQGFVDSWLTGKQFKEWLCKRIGRDNTAQLFYKISKIAFPLDNTLKNVTLGKQKATNVIRQVLGFDYLKEAVSTLRSQKFSFIINETTNKSTAKQLAILATYFDMESFLSKQFLLDMIEVQDGTANSIYSAVKQSFADLHVPVDNIIAYSSDTTNVMSGQFNSVAQLLKKDFPDVIRVKC